METGISAFLLRDERLPGLVIIEHTNLSNTTLWLVNDFYLWAFIFQSCTSYTIRNLCRLDDIF